MEAKELRIGVSNIFNPYDEVVTVDIPIIEYFLKQEKNKQPKDRYKPIPLTIEWLVKFGFKHDGVSADYILIFEVLHETHIHIDIDSGDITCAIFCPLEDAYFHLDIEYVHELQNLYFVLTGKELELKK